MYLLADHDGKRYRAVAIDRPADFKSPYSDGFFPCLIWDHDGRLSASDRSELAKSLLNAGCRYAVCAGQHCSEWHDVIDLEFVERHQDDPDDVQQAEHVMTSWHAGEEPDAVAFFFVLLTNFDHHDFNSTSSCPSATANARKRSTCPSVAMLPARPLR